MQPRSESALGENFTIVTVGAHRAPVLRAGAGPSLLLLHGEEGFAALRPLISQLAPDFSVIAPIHPGFGGDPAPDWLERVSDAAMYYLDFCDAIDLRDLHLVGASMGGWIAADLATRSTARLASLSLIAPAGLHVAGATGIDPFLMLDDAASRAMFHDPAVADAALAQVTGDDEDIRLQERVTIARLGWAPRLHDPALRKWLHRIDVPTLLLWGAQDRLFPPAYATAWQNLLPRARLHLLDACGHLPHVEQTAAAAAALRTQIEALS